MCLSSIDIKPRRKFGTGYKKVIKTLDGTYISWDRGENDILYPLNKWLIDPNDYMIDGGFGKYRTGFHISLDKENFNHCPIEYGHYSIGSRLVRISVRYKGIVATQCDEPDDFYGRQVVARVIMNLGEV